MTKNKNMIKKYLIEHLEQVLKVIIPAAKFTVTECRIGDVYGAAGNSLSICLVGKKRGIWYDHATNAGGTIVDFIAEHFYLNPKTEIELLFAKLEALLVSADETNFAVPLAINKPPPKFEEKLIKVAEWDYLNLDGSYYWSVVRFEDSEGKKSIRPYNKETKQFKCPPEPRLLYNLPGIKISENIIIVEGEKCATALIGKGYCATTAMLGANAPSSKTDWSPLKDKVVSIWPDNDAVGKQFAINSAKAAHAAGAKSCAILNLPDGLPEGWDVADGLAEDQNFDIDSFIKLGLEKGSIYKDSNKLYDAQPSQSEITVEELNKTYAAVFMSGQSFVLTEFVNAKGKMEIALCRLNELKLRHANKRVVITDLLKKRHDVCIIDAWMKDEKRRSYNGIVFAPQGAPSDFYNLFKGFPIQPIEGDCSLYLQHLSENICCGNVEYFEYLLSWMAHMIQRPSELPGVAIVFRGAQGTGKGLATDELGRLIEPHYIVLSGMEQLVGRFTGHLKDMILVYANEAIWGGNKSAEGALKAMITDQDSSIEQKFKDVIRLDNYKRIMVSSNEGWAVPVSKDDRRFLILDVSSKYKENHAYFGAIIDQMRNGGSEALMYFLKNRDLSEFNVRKVPQTPFNFDLKLLSMDSTDSFIYEYLREASEEDWDCSVCKSTLHNEYLDWCKNHGKKHNTTASVFGKQLKRILPSLTECKKKAESFGLPSKRQNHYIFSTLKICRTEFEKACKSDSKIWKL